MTDIIEIPCEGAGLPGYDAEYLAVEDETGMTCRMCGRAFVLVAGDELVPEHYRHDIVAMIARGDFDE